MRTTVCALAVFALLAVVGASAASANAPVITHYPNTTLSNPDMGICASPVALTWTLSNWSSTEFFDRNGNPTSTHWKFFEQDTFTGPQLTLTGDKYSLEVVWTYDSDGEVTHVYGDGVLEKLALPGGHGFWISVGRGDFVSSLPLEPEVGHTPDIAALCAALGA